MPILKTSTEIRAEHDRLLELANDPDPLVRALAKCARVSLSWTLGEMQDVPLVPIIKAEYARSWKVS